LISSPAAAQRFPAPPENLSYFDRLPLSDRHCP
jgi:hypothetical protein